MQKHLYQAAKDLCTDARPWAALSAIALDLGEDQKAAFTITKALAISPSDPDSLNLKGLIAKSKRQFSRIKKGF